MNIEYLRRALKSEWLTYYRKNRHWIVRLGVWVNCQGQRRPSASFILGTLSTLDPQLTQLLPLVVDLNSNPDRIIMVLGLNFNPEDELPALEAAETGGLLENPFSEQLPDRSIDASVKQLAPQTIEPTPVSSTAQTASSIASISASNTELPGSTAIDRSTQPAVEPSAEPIVTPTVGSAVQPTVQSTVQPTIQPAVKSLPETNASAQNANHRVPLDTAQLNSHELPDREDYSARGGNRNRRKARSD